MVCRQCRQPSGGGRNFFSFFSVIERYCNLFYLLIRLQLMMLFLRLVLALVVCLGVVQSASKVVEVGSEWKVCRSTADEIGDDCVQNAIVPGTVLTNLLKNGTFSGLGSAGIYLDNVYTDNNLALLPDIAETGPEFYEFWWSTKLDMIPAVRSGGKAILQLAGINYRARVVVDGQELQPMDGKEPVGT